MFKRRRIGAAYETYPAERLGRWAQRNLLSLVGGSVGLVVWCLLVIFAAKMLNWLNEGSGDSQVVFDDNGATGVAIKLIGGIVIFVLIVTRQSK